MCLPTRGNSPRGGLGREATHLEIVAPRLVKELTTPTPKVNSWRPFAAADFAFPTRGHVNGSVPAGTAQQDCRKDPPARFALRRDRSRCRCETGGRRLATEQPRQASRQPGGEYDSSHQAAAARHRASAGPPSLLVR